MNRTYLSIYLSPVYPRIIRIDLVLVVVVVEWQRWVVGGWVETREVGDLHC
jgi:hypothetical protein